MAIRTGNSIGADVIARDEHGNITGEYHATKKLYIDFNVKTIAMVK